MVPPKTDGDLTEKERSADIRDSRQQAVCT
jgi:hypothetical protein